MNNRVHIYTLADPRSGEVRYVGKTKFSLNARLMGHLNDKHKCHKTHWINSLKANGIKPSIEIIEESNLENWQEAERFWIASLRQIGCRLTNQKEGGEGGSLSFESRQKMSLWQTGRKLSASHIENMRIASTGRKHTQETKAKISQSGKGRKMPLEIIERIKASKRKNPAKTIAAIKVATEAARHRIISQEERDHRSRTMIGRKYPNRKPQSKESIAKGALARTGLKHTEETKRKMAIARANYWAKKSLAIQNAV